MRHRILLATTLSGALVVGLVAHAAAATPTDFDPTFGNGGIAATAPAPGVASFGDAVALDPAGDVIVAGSTGSAATPATSDVAVVRVTGAGVPDGTFGSGGTTTSHIGSGSAGVSGVAVTPSGAVLVAATSVSAPTAAPSAKAFLLRFTAAGIADSTFGAAGQVAVGADPTALTGMASDAAGNAIVAGLSSAPSATPANTAFIERISVVGNPDPAFGTRGVVSLGSGDVVTAVAVAADGHVLAAGVSARRPTLWRFTSAGTPDPAFGTAGKTTLVIPTASPESILPEPDGSAIVVADRDSDTIVAKITSAGNLDQTFGDRGGVEISVFGLSTHAGGALDPAGNITLAGEGGATGLWMARLKPDGALDRTFGPNGRMEVTPTSGAVLIPGRAPAIQADGKVVVPGTSFSGSPSAPTTALAAGRLTGGSGALTPSANLVNRLSGSDRVATAIAVSQATFDSPTGTDLAKLQATDVVLASAENYPDALVGTPLAASLGAPLLLSHSTALDPSVLTEIQRVLGPASGGGTVTILGGTVALSSVVESAVTGAGYAVKRIAGDDRFQTAVDVANALNPAAVLEATGTNFPDGVTGGAAAAFTHAAVLLTNGPTQAPATAAYLQANKPAAYAIGGAAAAADPSAFAVVGANRYETAADVAQTFFHTPVVVGVATGTDFADALSGGSRAAEFGAPVLLTDSTTISPSTASYLAANATWIDAADVFGGVAAVSDGVVASIRTAISETATTTAGGRWTSPVEAAQGSSALRAAPERSAELRPRGR